MKSSKCKVLSYSLNRKAGYIILETTTGFFRVYKSGRVERRQDATFREQAFGWLMAYEKNLTADGYKVCEATKGTGTPGGKIIATCYRILGV